MIHVIPHSQSVSIRFDLTIIIQRKFYEEQSVSTYSPLHMVSTAQVGDSSLKSNFEMNHKRKGRRIWLNYLILPWKHTTNSTRTIPGIILFFLDSTPEPERQKSIKKCRKVVDALNWHLHSPTRIHIHKNKAYWGEWVNEWMLYVSILSNALWIKSPLINKLSMSASVQSSQYNIFYAYSWINHCVNVLTTHAPPSITAPSRVIIPPVPTLALLCAALTLPWLVLPRPSRLIPECPFELATTVGSTKTVLWVRVYAVVANVCVACPTLASGLLLSRNTSANPGDGTGIVHVPALVLQLIVVTLRSPLKRPSTSKWFPRVCNKISEKLLVDRARLHIPGQPK